MNKKFLSVVLFGALLSTSISTFTSCKDYDDDINAVQERVDKNETAIGALQTQLTTLQSAAETAKTTADAAKAAADKAQSAADAAKSAGDAAMAAAEQAKVDAQNAIAAIATAKQEAIAEAVKEVEALKALMEGELAKKVDQSVYDAFVSAVNGKIEGIQAGLGTLENNVAKNASDIQNIYDLIGTATALDQDLLTQLNALQEYKALSEGKIGANEEAIEKAESDIAEAQKEIIKLWNEINAENTGLKDLIGENAVSISNLMERMDIVEGDLEVLDAKVTRELEKIQEQFTNVAKDIQAINDQIIGEILPDIASLHTLITSRLTSITFAPSYFVDGVEALKFTSLKYAPMKDDENEGIPSKDYILSTANLTSSSYHFNPASFNLANADYRYIDRRAEIEVTPRMANESQLVAIEGAPVLNPTTGTVDFQLRRLNAVKNEKSGEIRNIIALQATLKGEAVDKDENNVVITSPYVMVRDIVMAAEDVRIADKATLVEKADEAHYAVKFNACKEEAPRYEMPYNKEFDLKSLVATCLGNGSHEEFPVADYKLSYRFAVASSAYNIESELTTTNQQKYIICKDAEKGLFVAEGFNKESIGRTPILKVELIDENGKVVRRGFVKVKVVASKQDDLVIGGLNYDLVYKCNETAANYEISEEYMRENLYRIISNGRETGMSHEEFWTIYDAADAKATVTKNGMVSSISNPEIQDGLSGVGTATKKVVWNFTHGEIGSVGSGAVLVGTITVKNKLVASEYPAQVTFKFTVNVTLPEFSLDKKENGIYWVQENGQYKAFKVNVNVPKSTSSFASNCQFDGLLTDAYSTYNVTFPKQTCIEDRYEVVSTRADGIPTGSLMEGVKIEDDHISLDKNDTDVRAALNSPGGLQAIVAHIYTLENGDDITVNEFIVTFIRPMNLNMPSGVSVTDAKNDGDVANFQWNGLLTDWRNEAVVKSDMEWVDKIKSHWTRVCVTNSEYVDGHYEILTPAKLEVITGTVSFTTSTPTKMYTATAEYKFRKTNHGGYTQFIEFTSQQVGSKDQADMDLEAQVLEYMKDNSYIDKVKKANTTYKEIEVSGGQKIEYTYVKDIKYTPATYRWVSGELIKVPHKHTYMPAFEGHIGEIIGCWQWVEYEKTELEWIPGQYWAFYGKFSDIKADVTKATTNYDGQVVVSGLRTGKLPTNVSLMQEGNTVKYKNSGSPIGFAYEIYIPVTVTYGWGTLTEILTIIVNPVGDAK